MAPSPALLKTQPVRPQNRVFRLFGVLIVTLRPAGSTQPVAASGVAGLGTRMRWRTRQWPGRAVLVSAEHDRACLLPRPRLSHFHNGRRRAGGRDNRNQKPKFPLFHTDGCVY